MDQRAGMAAHAGVAKHVGGGRHGALGCNGGAAPRGDAGLGILTCQPPTEILSCSATDNAFGYGKLFVILSGFTRQTVHIENPILDARNASGGDPMATEAPSIAAFWIIPIVLCLLVIGAVFYFSPP